jgi:hypothetical protein
MDRECHYCEKDITDNNTGFVSKKSTGERFEFHYPDCYVRFTTFYKTEKELAEWRKGGYGNEKK